MTRVGVLGVAAQDTVTLEGDPPIRRPGGTPLFAERALRAAGAEPATVVFGSPIDSRLVHRGGTTTQEIRSPPPALSVAQVVREVLPALRDCRRVLLGGHTRRGVPPGVGLQRPAHLRHPN